MAIEPRQERTGWFPSRTTLALAVFSAIGAFFLLTEHTAHVFGALPFVLLLGCVLMHFFMHGGHGSHGADDAHARGQEQQPEGVPR